MELSDAQRTGRSREGVKTRTYPVGAQWALLVDETYEYIFDTLGEVHVMSDKLNKASTVQALITEFGGIDDLLDIINAREYGQLQAEAITDSDVESLHITAADFFNALNLLTQVKTLLTNGVPTQGDYMSIVNRVRSD